jgi:hypothetical protein
VVGRIPKPFSTDTLLFHINAAVGALSNLGTRSCPSSSPPEIDLASVEPVPDKPADRRARRAEEGEVDAEAGHDPDIAMSRAPREGELPSSTAPSCRSARIANRSCVNDRRGAGPSGVPDPQYRPPTSSERIATFLPRDYEELPRVAVDPAVVGPAVEQAILEVLPEVVETVLRRTLETSGRCARSSRPRSRKRSRKRSTSAPDGGLARRLEQVADTANGPDPSVADLGSQLPDIHVDHVRVRIDVEAPGLLPEEGPRQPWPGFRAKTSRSSSSRSERSSALPSSVGAMPCGVDHERTEPQILASRLRRPRPPRARRARARTRLREVVVRAHAQPGGAILGRGERGDHDRRQGDAALAKLLDEPEPVAVGKDAIDEEEIGPVARDGVARGAERVDLRERRVPAVRAPSGRSNASSRPLLRRG